MKNYMYTIIIFFVFGFIACTSQSIQKTTVKTRPRCKQQNKSLAWRTYNDERNRYDNARNEYYQYCATGYTDDMFCTDLETTMNKREYNMLRAYENYYNTCPRGN